jgi:hypothetical protein
MKVRRRSIIRSVSAAFCTPSCSAQPLQLLALLLVRFAEPLLELPLRGPGLEVADIAEDQRHEGDGVLTPSRPGDVDLADAPHPVLIEEGTDGVARLAATVHAGQLIEEAVAAGAFQECHHLGMAANGVGDVEQRAPSPT